MTTHGSTPFAAPPHGAGPIQPIPPTGVPGRFPGRRGRWLIALVLAWAVVVAVVGYVSSRHDKPTVREQTTIASAQPTVDRAAGAVAAAGAGAVVAVSGYDKVSDCDLTAVRRGAWYHRLVSFVTRPGDEGALLDRIGSALPHSYRARVTRGGSGVPTLSADAGNFVGLSGTVPGPGEVRVEIGTGCRPLGDLRTPGAGQPRPDERAEAERVLAAVPVPVGSWQVTEVPCGTGTGTLRTAEAVGSGAPPSVPLGDVVHPPAGATGAVTAPGLMAYRSGALATLVRADATSVTVSITSGCGTG
ncbi:MAG TPA: hypothetical protein VF054_15220 [Micromonosporaceae bacterium]